MKDVIRLAEAWVLAKSRGEKTYYVHIPGVSVGFAIASTEEQHMCPWKAIVSSAGSWDLWEDDSFFLREALGRIQVNPQYFLDALMTTQGREALFGSFEDLLIHSKYSE